MRGSHRPRWATFRQSRNPRLSRRLTTVLVALLLSMIIGVPLISAAVVLTDDRTTVLAEQTIDEDAYIFSNEVDFNGTATRDIVAATNTFALGETARVGGNVNVAANKATLAGAIQRSVRVAARDITIRGTIDGDLVVAAQTVRIEAGARITGDLLVAARNVTVLGTIDGDIRGNAGTLTITNGRIGQNLDLSVDDLNVQGTSQVGGAIRYSGDPQARIATSAAITGPVERTESSALSAGGYSLASGLAWDIARLLSLLFTGLVVVLVAPVASAAVADGVRRRFPTTLIVGVIAIVLVPVVAVLMLITLIGIPVSIVSLILYGVALYLSQIFVGLAIGRAILPRGWRSYGRGYNLLAMVIGVILIGLLRLIPIPFLDLVLATLVALLGLGALFTANRDDIRPASTVQPASGFGDPYYGVPNRA